MFQSDVKHCSPGLNASYFASLHLGFLSCKVGTKMVWGLKERLHVKPQAQGLARTGVQSVRMMLEMMIVRGVSSPGRSCSTRPVSQTQPPRPGRKACRCDSSSRNHMRSSRGVIETEEWVRAGSDDQREWELGCEGPLCCGEWGAHTCGDCDTWVCKPCAK